MSEVSQSIIKGLEEAVAFARGENVGARVHIPEEIDVRRIRKKLNLSQTKFAERFGIKVKTLRDWEQGRRVPESSARAYLSVIDKEPEAVYRALAV